MAGYLGMIKRLDEALGRLVDALISLDLLEDTIILFTSDHGNHFKTRNDEYKRSPHDASARVPTMLYGGTFSGGGRISQPVSLIDLPPTLLDGAGIPVPDAMSGRSILPLIRGEAVDWHDEVFIQYSESIVGRAIRSRRWLYAITAPDKDGWKDPGSDRYVEAELYDLLADPDQLRNLAGYDSHRQVCDILRSRLLKRMLAAGEDEPLIERAPQHAFSRGMRASQIQVDMEEGWL